MGMSNGVLGCLCIGDYHEEDSSGDRCDRCERWARRRIGSGPDADHEHGFGPAFMQGHGPGRMGPGMMGRGHRGMGPGIMGMNHGSATTAEMSAIHELFANHDRIKRTVTNLPDGIRTATESDDPRIAELR